MAEQVQAEQAPPEWVLKVDDPGKKPRIFQWSPVLGEMANMVPCDGDGNRTDVKGQDPGDVMQIELASLRAKVKKLETDPAQTVVADLRNSLALRDKQVGELRSQLAEARRDAATTVQVAGEVDGGDAPNELFAELDALVNDKPDDKPALEAFANQHAGISLDGRRKYPDLVEEVREALRAAVE